MFVDIYFDGYKSFSDKCTTSLPDIKHCNIIIGKNNSGKSSLLDVVAASIDEEYFIKYGKSISKLSASYIIDNDSLGEIFSHYISINGIIQPHIYAQSFIGKPYKVAIERSGPNARYSMLIKENDIFTSSSLGDQWKGVANNIAGKLSNFVFRRIRAERNISPEIESRDESLAEDGRGATNLIRKIINYSGYDEALVEHTLLYELNTIMKPEIEFEEIKIQQISQGEELLWEVFLREKGYNRYALSQSGSGLKTVVLVLLNLLVIPKTNAYSNKIIVYGFEELENNLHPALQRRLFDYIYNFSVTHNIYVFLTTHSHIAINTFFGREDANIYHVVKNSKGSSVKKIDNYIDKVEILDDLDVKASDLLQSNGIIWVEGPSDRIYIKHWLKIFCNNKYIEGADYQFMYYGGRLLSHYSTEQTEDLLNILTTNRNAAIIMDSDKRSRQASINTTKKRIVKEFSMHGMFSWLTEGKEIENYIPANAITEAFACSNLEECGQYELFPTYIEKICPDFSSQKILFARSIVEKITVENSKEKLDLKKQIEELYNQIQKWNC